MKKSLIMLLCAMLIAAPLASLAEGVTASIETETQGDLSIQYVQVAGLADAVIQSSLNEALKDYALREYFDGAAHDWNSLSGSASYSIIGGRYLSVRTEYLYDGDPPGWPQLELLTRVFDLTTGDLAGPVTDFMLVDEELRSMIATGVFDMTHPSPAAIASIDNAAERFVETYINNFNPDIYNNCFYLTDTTFGLVLNFEVQPAPGGYWTYEAPYDSVIHLLSPELVEALGK